MSDQALDTTRGLGDALALHRRFAVAPGVRIVPGPPPAHSTAQQTLRRPLWRSTARRAVCFLEVRRTVKIALILVLGVSHALAACTQETEWNKLNAKTETLYQQGRYSEAAKIAQEALEVAEKTFGADHPNLATSLNNLALLYQAQGEYAAAEPLHKRALAIREKALGPDHPQVAASLNNLAALYYAQGKYAEAEPLIKRALAIGEKALGPNHPDVAQSLNNLAELYKKTGRTNEAKRLEERAKGIRSRNQ